jgi:hypothetical protein
VTGKVLGIGLSRTGTLSLALALRQLGYRTAHFAEHHGARRGLSTWLAGDFSADELAGYDAAVDLPVATCYPGLDARYPGSKFILTVREQTGWLASMARLWERRPVTADADSGYRSRVRLATYGSVAPDPASLADTAVRHRRAVLEYFANRPADLLVLDVCAGDGWDELCGFLGRPRPQVPFPWAHRDS